MYTKNRYPKYLVLLVLILTLTNCEKALEEDPRDIISPNAFFNSRSEAKSAVNGIYAIYKNNSLYGQIGLERFYAYGTDEIGPSRNFDQVEPYQNYIINEGNISSITQAMGAPITWQDLYQIIQNANLILDRVEGNEEIQEADKNQLIGETLFLRALAYFHLTNLWGDVPYYTDVLSINEISTLGRSDKSEIRNEILEDLQIAQNLLPGSYSDDENGRSSKWVAAMVIAKIYLVQQRWAEARDKSLDIISNSPHFLLADYSEVFSDENEYNGEIIWELDYVKDIPSQQVIGVPSIPGNGYWFPSIFTPRIRDEPENSDERDALLDSLNTLDQGFTGTGLAVALPDLVDKFPIDDLRRPLNVLDSYLGFQLNFPYMPKFWNLDQINSPRFNHPDNKIIYRLADVYLMAAEAENELNGPANAYQYINEVRKRAYEPDQPLSGLTQEQFRQAIYDERKWELAGENHRRFDLIRWGILLDVVKTTQYRLYNPAQNIQPHHVLFPIPPEELLLNPALLESDPTNNGYR